MPINKVEGQKKNGQQKYRVRVSYTDRMGKKKQIERTAYGLAEAKSLEEQLRRETKNSPSANMTVLELYHEYVERQKYEVRESTLDKAKSWLNLYVLPLMEKEKIDRLTVPLLQNWKNEINKKPLSVTTKNNIYTSFRALLNYAVKMEYIPKNPLTAVGNFKDAYSFDGEIKSVNYYTAEEFQKYIEIARKNSSTLYDWGFYVFFCIAFYTGMRKGEINALKWSDIEGNIIHVRRNIVQKLKGQDRETPPKNKSSYRDIQMPAPLVRVLEEQKERQKKRSRFSEDMRICGGTSCLRDSSIQHRNVEYAKEACVKHIRVHDFRHSHASLLANAGINIQEIARRLGHSNVEITWNTYSHLYPKEEERAVEVLNKIEA